MTALANIKKRERQSRVGLFFKNRPLRDADSHLSTHTKAVFKEVALKGCRLPGISLPASERAGIRR